MGGTVGAAVPVSGGVVVPVPPGGGVAAESSMGSPRPPLSNNHNNAPISGIASNNSSHQGKAAVSSSSSSTTAGTWAVSCGVCKTSAGAAPMGCPASVSAIISWLGSEVAKAKNARTFGGVLFSL